MSDSATTVDSELNPNLYRPTEDEVAFFKFQTGIQGEEELKQHILKIQQEAWDVSSVSLLPLCIATRNNLITLR